MTPQEVNKILDEAIKQKKMTADFVKGVGPAIVEALKPTLDKIADNSRLPKDEILKAISQIKVNVSDIKVPKPNITIPPIIVPKADAPIINYIPPEVKVNVPAIDIRALAAKIQLPNEMNIKGWVGFMGYDRGLLNDPLPVQIRDSKGNPVMFTGGGAVISGGGGVAHQVKINNATTNPVPVQIVSGASSTSGVNVLDSGGVAYSGSNPLPVTITSGATATSAVNLVDSTGVAYSGSNPVPVGGTVIVSDITASVQSALINSSGEQYSGSNPLPVGGTVAVSEITNTVAVTPVDSSGIAYSGSNPQRQIIVDTTGAELDLFKQGDNFAVGSDHGLGILGLSDGIPKKYAFIRVEGVDTDAETPLTEGAMSTESYNMGYDPYAGTWNRLRTGSGYDNPGVLRVVHATDVGMSVNVIGATSTIGATLLNGEGLARDSWAITGIASSISVSLIDSGGIQYSGSNPVPMTIAVSNPTNTVNVRIVDSGGVGYDGSNGMPIRLASGTNASLSCHLEDSSGIGYDGSNPMWVRVSSAGNTTGTNIHDSSGVAYGGSNPMPVTWASGSNTSTVSVGTTVSDAVDDGSAPVKNGGIARTANPTAVGGGDTVTMSMDDLGRQLTRPVQVRDLIATAYVSKATGSTFGTETTLLASGSGVYLDLIYVMGTNDSTAAIQVDLRASTGGTICKTLEIPAGGTAGLALPVPYPAPFVDHTWTIDLPDVTGTNVTISALFSKEI